jgi:crossover junction endodeoxyribonuclease RuvC
MDPIYKNCSIFVGIDQSLNSTGYYIINQNPEVDDIKGLIKPGNRRGAKRLSYIFNKLQEILSEYEASDVLVCMEGYAYDYREGKVFELGEVGGIVKLCLHNMGILFFRVPPSDLKKFATGRGSASKEKMTKAMKERQNDIADAKGLALIAQEICLKETKERSKLEVIKNALSSGRDLQEKPKYKREKKTSRTAAEVCL